MNKVIGIHLNGNAFQVEEPGYAALQTYLDEARRQLAGHPDASEVLLDLEQAIADKCRRFLGANKNVVLNDEIAQILEEMGPVRAVDTSVDSDAPGGAAGQTRADSESGLPPGQPHKLYRLKNDRMVEGICSGLGAYLGVDPTIIRVFAAVLLVLSGGTAAVVYLVLVVVIPEATTPEEHAAAHGSPFDADEVLRRAKANLQGLHQTSEQRHLQRRHASYWLRHRNGRKGCLGLALTFVAFIFGVSLLMKWLRWPFNSSVIQENLLTPYQPWAQIAIFLVLIVGLSALVRRLVQSGRGTGNLVVTILRFCLFILVLVFVAYLVPVMWAGSLALWNGLFGRAP